MVELVLFIPFYAQISLAHQANQILFFFAETIKKG